MKLIRTRATIGAFAVASAIIPASLTAQLGKQQGLLDPNVTADTILATLPHMSLPLAQALREARPVLGPIPMDSILAAKGLSKTQRADLYAKMFVHVDVNRGSDAEILLIPGVDAKKLAAIKSKRPWKSFADFQAEVGKATSASEATRLEQYLFIPIDLNTFTNDIMDTFASIGVGTSRWKREFVEYRPWTSQEQFEREIGKYVRTNPNEVKRLWRYVVINK
jgi:hypothetical protein